MSAELNSKVAKDVMGWEQVGGENSDIFRQPNNILRSVRAIYPNCRPFLPSIRIEYAWEVVNEFRRGALGHVAACVETLTSDIADAPDSLAKIYGPDIKEVTGVANEMPEAICLAALSVAEQTANNSEYKGPRQSDLF